MTKSEIWQHLYFHRDLRKMSRKMVGELYEDLISESIIHAFEKKTIAELNEFNERKKLEGYIYRVLFSFAYNKFDRFAKNYRHLEHDEPIDDYESFDEQVSVIDITSEEANQSALLFGSVTDRTIKTMREIDRCDEEKSYPAYESAQYFKIYLESGSLRKAERKVGLSYKTISLKVNQFTKKMMQKPLDVRIVTYDSQPINGMELYRLFYPYSLVKRDSIDVSIEKRGAVMSEELKELEGDVYVFSRLSDVKTAIKVKENNKTLIIDMDDYWKLPKEHPKYGDKEFEQSVTGVLDCMKYADHITTTSDVLANYIYEETGKQATVIKNTIPEETQFVCGAYPHSKVRFGWIGGVYHLPDIELMRSAFKTINNDVNLRGKYQFILGGFNLSARKDGDLPEYIRLEKVFTDDYKSVKGDYRDYLHQFTQALDHYSLNQSYRRLWAKPVTQYGEMYRNIDVALIPLCNNPFNTCKSELKLIEAGMTGTAVICSDVAPYSQHLVNEANCLAVKNNSWTVPIRRMMLDSDFRKECAKNMYWYIKKNFDAKTESDKLVKLLGK